MFFPSCSSIFSIIQALYFYYLTMNICSKLHKVNYKILIVFLSTKTVSNFFDLTKSSK